MKIRSKIIITFSLISFLAIVIVSIVILRISFDNTKKITDAREKLNAKLISSQIDSAFGEQRLRMLAITNTENNKRITELDDEIKKFKIF